jgi:glycine amidinotransferase
MPDDSRHGRRTEGAGAALMASPVSTHNEWDPLEEVIVGTLEGARMPPPHISVTRNLPRNTAKLYRLVGGLRYPKLIVEAARKELDGFVELFHSEGITVRRPSPLDFSRRVRTPFWASRGFCVACPRDCFLVLGDEILETPSPWRSRYFEAFAYRSLFQEYFSKGARWTAAPRPELKDELFDYAFTPSGPDEPMHYVINESEPVFDAADFVRCGRDLFCIRSNVTNRAGIEWLRRHVGDRYRIHEIWSRCRTPMHIDSTFMPLAPGRVLINPDWIDPQDLPPALKSWEVLVAPRPDPIPRSEWRFKLAMSSPWISINVLMLDPHRVVVERTQTTLIRRFKEWGFEPIALPFLSYAAFGGSFHCATLDIRRRGMLRSYCD